MEAVRVAEIAGPGPLVVAAVGIAVRATQLKGAN